MRSFWDAVEALDNEVDRPPAQLDDADRGPAAGRARNPLAGAGQPAPIDIEPGDRALRAGGQADGAGAARRARGRRLARPSTSAPRSCATAGVPAELADRAAGMPSLYSVFDIVEVAASTGRDQAMVMTVYAGWAPGSGSTGCATGSSSCRAPTAGRRWRGRRCARTSTACTERSPRRCSRPAGAQADGEEAIDAWIERNEVAVERCMGMLADINASSAYDTTTLPVALREVRNLIHADGGTGADRSQRSASATTAASQDQGASTVGRRSATRPGSARRGPPAPNSRRPPATTAIGHERQHVDHAGQQKPAGR